MLSLEGGGRGLSMRNLFGGFERLYDNRVQINRLNCFATERNI
jgi:hypothetical protein